jgi:hypothetical protein
MAGAGGSTPAESSYFCVLPGDALGVPRSLRAVRTWRVTSRSRSRTMRSVYARRKRSDLDAHRLGEASVALEVVAVFAVTGGVFGLR